MQYKTIVLGLLQEQYPALHERLRASRSLLQAMNDYAASLKHHHESWMDRLSVARPERDPIQISSQALELAIEDLRDDLPSNSRPSESEGGTLSPDEIMAFVRNHTPPA
jgi:hypothetical protein